MRPGLWTGGLATAVVAALVAVVGVLVARGLFDVPVLAPHRGGRARQRKHCQAGRPGRAARHGVDAPAAAVVCWI
jgi:hypothetical protein